MIFETNNDIHKGSLCPKDSNIFKLPIDKSAVTITVINVNNIFLLIISLASLFSGTTTSVTNNALNKYVKIIREVATTLNPPKFLEYKLAQTYSQAKLTNTKDIRYKSSFLYV